MDLPVPDRTLLAEHIRAVLDGVNAFGADPMGGWSRVAFSDADMAARRWLRKHFKDLGLDARVDAIGNVIGRWGPPDAPAILLGSHTDTVPRGGAFDGVFGVAAGVAALMALRARDPKPPLAIEVISFADEEGRFGGMFGSQALSGQIAPGWVDAAHDADGIFLVEAMRRHGLDAHAAHGVARAPGSVRAYIEAHVEQGPVLETAGVPVGIAPSITGVCVTRTELTGQADHSGTTPMGHRRDALAAAAEAIAAIPRMLAELGAPDARATVGKLDVRPNTPHTIPGAVDFTAVLRDGDASVIRALEEGVAGVTATAATRHGVASHTERLSWLSPVELDPGLSNLAAHCAREAGIGYAIVPSGAGHDAQSMQALCPSALLFAPSRGGISHAPEEHTDMNDMAEVAAVMVLLLNRLIRETL